MCAKKLFSCALMMLFVVSGVMHAAYFENFEMQSKPLPEWSDGTRERTPTDDRGFLGQFGSNKSVDLTLMNLPPHDKLRIAFDLYVIRSWDGSTNASGFPGPDIWKLMVDGGPPLVNTTFANNAGGNPDVRQAYPGAYPEDDNDPRAGAAENNTLGYTHAGGPRDAVYRIEVICDHSAATAVITFAGSGLQSKHDESWGLDNVSVSTVSGCAFYDFEDAQDPLPDWSVGRMDTTPVGDRGFLGQFSGNQAATLTLDNLSAHTHVYVALDLFIIRSWDGSAATASYPGPDIWSLLVEGGPTLIHTTFANSGTAAPDRYQAYPGAYPDDVHPPRTGAVENNTLGYTHGGGARDSVYRMVAVFPHADATLALTFAGRNLQSQSDESWGIDNVMVCTETGPIMEPPFRRGDVNIDGNYDLSDPIALLGYLFNTGIAIKCHDAADANDDGKLDLSDPISILDYLFGSGKPLPAPMGTCGHDATEDGLPCVVYDKCN